MYTLTQAFDIVATNNKLSVALKKDLVNGTMLLLSHIPTQVINHPSFCIALRGRGNYISINIMNYLIFRTPAYKDNGGAPVYDCHIIFEDTASIVAKYGQDPERTTFQFQDFPSVNIGLWYDELLSLSPSEWQDFEAACEAAMTAKRTRRWASNIQFPWHEYNQL